MKKYIALYFEEVFDGTNEVMIRAIAGGDSAVKCKKAVLESRTPWGWDSEEDTWEACIKNRFPDLKYATVDEMANINESFTYYEDGRRTSFNRDDHEYFYWKTDEAVARILIGAVKKVSDLNRSYFEVIVRSDDEDFEDCTERFADMVIDTRGHDH